MQTKAVTMSRAINHPDDLDPAETYRSYSTWCAAVLARGLMVKVTDPQCSMAWRAATPLMAGGNEGYFDHTTKTGSLNWR